MYLTFSELTSNISVCVNDQQVEKEANNPKINVIDRKKKLTMAASLFLNLTSLWVWTECVGVLYPVLNGSLAWLPIPP